MHPYLALVRVLLEFWGCGHSAKLTASLDVACRCLAVDAPSPEEKLTWLSDIAQEHGVEWDAHAAALEMLPAEKQGGYGPPGGPSFSAGGPGFGPGPTSGGTGPGGSGPGSSGPGFGGGGSSGGGGGYQQPQQSSNAYQQGPAGAKRKASSNA